jgi:hypothetical protein
VSEWQKIETAPELERIWVCGWQKKTKGFAGYWWWSEDMIVDGKAMDHPDATHWAPIVLPLSFPPPPEAG